MEISDYLFKDVNGATGTALYFRDYLILKNVRLSFNDEWRGKLKEVKPYLMYDESTESLGIYLNREGKDILIKNSHGLSEEEKTLIEHFYLAVERELTKLQGPRQKSPQ